MAEPVEFKLWAEGATAAVVMIDGCFFFLGRVASIRPFRVIQMGRNRRKESGQVFMAGQNHEMEGGNPKCRNSRENLVELNQSSCNCDLPG